MGVFHVILRINISIISLININRLVNLMEKNILFWYIRAIFFILLGKKYTLMT